MKSIKRFFVRSDLYKKIPNERRIGGVGCNISAHIKDEPNSEYIEGTLLTSGDLVVLMIICSWNFREIMLLLFLYNNKEKFTDIEINSFLLNSSFDMTNYNGSFKDITNDEFVFILSLIMSDTLDHYSSLDTNDILERVTEAGIFPTSLFNTKDGISFLYTLYMRTFIYSIYNYNEDTKGQDVKYIISNMFKLNDCLKVDIIKKYLKETTNSDIDLNVDSADENNIFTSYFSYKLFISMVIIFYSAIVELNETYRYNKCSFLKKYFNKNLDIDDNDTDNLMNNLVKLLLNEDDIHCKYITNISLDVENIFKMVEKNKILFH